MQSRAKIHHVAVLIGTLVNLTVPKVFLRFSSTLVTIFRMRFPPVDNRFVMSSSSFDCNRSPDAWALGLWDSLQPSKSDTSGSVTSGVRHPMLDLDCLALGPRIVEPSATGLPIP